mgnify:CR=1 FL=1
MSDEKISTKVLCAIFATGILSFCGVAGETAMNITFPVLMKAFSVNTSTVQWVTTIYLLVVACVVPLSQAFIQDENHLSCRKPFVYLRCSHRLYSA